MARNIRKQYAALASGATLVVTDSAANLLLADNAVGVVLASTVKVSMATRRCVLALARRFRAVFVAEPSIEETRRIAPYQNATGLQVTSAVLAGMVWALENPNAGIVEADEMDFRRCLEVQAPYLGPLIGQYTDWTPLKDRGWLFREETDKSDPWQFKNFVVGERD